MFKVLTFKHILSPHKLYSITKRFVSFQLDAKDTIYALSSGPITKSGVSVIRISGSSALKCAQTLCQKKADNQRPLFRERVVTLRHLYCPKSRDVLDQSLVLWFPAPRSFTGEDVVELHVHGSRAVIIGIMESLEYLDSIFRNNNNNGIRPAERGEFTRRAFENGRMDLTEVEGLSDLLEAETAQQRKQALLQMDGHQRKIYEAWRQELVRCLAHTEAVIDFGDDDREDDVTDAALEALFPRVTQLLCELRRHLGDGRRGEMVRQGVRIALAGPPNAGKSSLLNALARRPAAIVSPIAGTTRDIVEVRLDLNGVPCTVSDTAGLRLDSSDPIEQEGMRRARDEFRRAHVKIFVADSSDPTSLKSALSLLNDVLEEESHQTSSEVDVTVDNKNDPQLQVRSPVLLVLNKADLSNQGEGGGGGGGGEGGVVLDRLETPHHSISCVSGEGVGALEQAISDAVRKLLESGGSGESPLITRERHRRHVTQCALHLENFLARTLPMDAAAEELRLAMLELGRVTGAADVEELLDVIFRDFCIGK